MYSKGIDMHSVLSPMHFFSHPANKFHFARSIELEVRRTSARLLDRCSLLTAAALPSARRPAVVPPGGTRPSCRSGSRPRAGRPACRSESPRAVPATPPVQRLTCRTLSAPRPRRRWPGGSRHLLLTPQSTSVSEWLVTGLARRSVVILPVATAPRARQLCACRRRTHALARHRARTRVSLSLAARRPEEADRPSIFLPAAKGRAPPTRRPPRQLLAALARFARVLPPLGPWQLAARRLRAARCCAPSVAQVLLLATPSPRSAPRMVELRAPTTPVARPLAALSAPPALILPATRLGVVSSLLPPGEGSHGGALGAQIHRRGEGEGDAHAATVPAPSLAPPRSCLPSPSPTTCRKQTLLLKYIRERLSTFTSPLFSKAIMPPTVPALLEKKMACTVAIRKSFAFCCWGQPNLLFNRRPYAS